MAVYICEQTKTCLAKVGGGGGVAGEGRTGGEGRWLQGIMIIAETWRTASGRPGVDLRPLTTISATIGWQETSEEMFHRSTVAPWSCSTLSLFTSVHCVNKRR